jgi:hypothetical protein
MQIKNAHAWYMFSTKQLNIGNVGVHLVAFLNQIASGFLTDVQPRRSKTCSTKACGLRHC